MLYFGFRGVMYGSTQVDEVDDMNVHRLGIWLEEFEFNDQVTQARVLSLKGSFVVFVCFDSGYGPNVAGFITQDEADSFLQLLRMLYGLED